VLKKNILFVHGAKCSGTEQNVLVRAPNVLACNIPPIQLHISSPSPPQGELPPTSPPICLGGGGKDFVDTITEVKIL
jgi:hypothetical protein